MLFELPDDDILYEALLARDARYDGRAFVCVTSTGVFCRLSCPARNPKRENSIFMDSVAACIESGFRPCRRCKPLGSLAEMEPLVSDLIQQLEQDPGRRWREADLEARGYDPSTVRRAFKRHFGITFLEMARAGRIRTAAGTLSAGSNVIEAQLDAGFDSASGFRAVFAKTLGRPPSSFTGDEHLKADWIKTPLGPMIAVADQHALHLLEFFDRKALPRELVRLQSLTGAGIGIGRLSPTDQIEEELGLYFDGAKGGFAVPLALPGTPFERLVWRALQEIPLGETRSYAEMARAIGKPSAVRAMGRANGANQFAIVVPCHRVVAADGDLTGYGGGLWRKRWLIDHERRLAATQSTLKIEA
ncbi:bifunctional transcriptional activator/DNA repair enzyme AdaA [Pelagibius sp.]|uniref:bifunctional transcriptional activator/DNA repair enzyme AdaA n=1 Tax=Pelagibius sp. TaxID=1931238 RepID=UPI003BB0EE7C